MRVLVMVALQDLTSSVLEHSDLFDYCIVFISVFLVNALFLQYKWNNIFLMKPNKCTDPEDKIKSLDVLIIWYWRIALSVAIWFRVVMYCDWWTESDGMTLLRYKLINMYNKFTQHNDANKLVMGVTNVRCGIVLLVLTWVIHTSKAEVMAQHIFGAHNIRDLIRCILKQVQLMSRIGTLSLFLSFYVKEQKDCVMFLKDLTVVAGLFLVSMYYANALFRIVNPIAYFFAGGGKDELLKLMKILMTGKL
jgi:hypothetical protein